MIYLHKQEPIAIFHKENFSKPFDGFLCVFDEDKTKKKTTDSSVIDVVLAQVKEYNHFSWDGNIFWINDRYSESFFDFLTQWLEDNKEQCECEKNLSEDGISQLVFYSKTKTGCAFVDPLADSDSHFTEITDAFIRQYEIEEDCYINLDDSHLVDNLKLGRNMNHKQNTYLAFLHREGFLNESILFFAEFDDSTIEEDRHSITLVGDFFIEKEEAEAVLTEFFDIVEDIEKTLPEVAWIGHNVSNEKIEYLKEKGVKVLELDELIDYYQLHYFED